MNNTSSSDTLLKVTIIILLLIIVFMLSFGFFYFNKNSLYGFSDGSNTKTLDIQQNEAKITESSKISPNQEVIAPSIQKENKQAIHDIVPVPNTIYHGTYNGEDIIFLSRKITEDGQNNTYYGTMTKRPIMQDANFNYKDISNPVRIMGNDNNYNILSFNFDKPKNIIYLSVSDTINKDQINHDYNRILQITNYGKPIEILSREMAPNKEKYDGFFGPADITLVSEKYLLLNISTCNRCSPPEGSVGLVLNTETKNEKFYGKIGDIRIDAKANKIIYKKLSKVKKPCEPNPACGADGTMSVFEIAGEDYTDTLP